MKSSLFVAPSVKEIEKRKQNRFFQCEHMFRGHHVQKLNFDPEVEVIYISEVCACCRIERRMIAERDIKTNKTLLEKIIYYDPTT